MKDEIIITEPAVVDALSRLKELTLEMEQILARLLGNTRRSPKPARDLGPASSQGNLVAENLLEGAPPSGLEAEEALLRVILLDEMALPIALETGLKPDDFHKEAHAEIFRACVKLDADRQPVDQVTVAETLKNFGTLDKCGGPTYLARLYDGIGLWENWENADHYARIIIAQATLRQLISLSEGIAQRGQGSPTEVGDLLDWAESEILKISSERRAGSFINAAEKLIYEVFPEILNLKDAHRDGLALTGLPTGYDALDKLTGGFQPSDLIVLASRPGQGKRSLALNLALNAALPDQRQSFRQLPAAAVAFFSLEMNHKELLFRLLCQMGRFNLKELRTGWIFDEDIVPLCDTIDLLGKTRIYIDDTPALRVLELRTKARRLQSQLQSQGSALGLIVVDYFQLLMRGGRCHSRDNFEQKISRISYALKSLAKELNLPVLVLLELHRAMEKRSASGKEKKTKLSDLQPFMAIERCADLIAFIHWTETEKENEAPERRQGHQVELLIEKNRNGLTGCVPFYFNGSSYTFLPGDAPDSEIT